MFLLVIGLQIIYTYDEVAFIQNLIFYIEMAFRTPVNSYSIQKYKYYLEESVFMYAVILMTFCVILCHVHIFGVQTCFYKEPTCRQPEYLRNLYY